MTSTTRSAVIGYWKSGAAIEQIMDLTRYPYWYIDFIIIEYRKYKNALLSKINPN